MCLCACVRERHERIPCSLLSAYEPFTSESCHAWWHYDPFPTTMASGSLSVCFMCCLREMFAYTNSAYRGSLSCVLARMPISIATQSQRKRERGFEQTSRLLHHPCHSIATMSIWSRPLKTLINWKWVLQGHDGRRFSAQIVKIIWLNDQSQQVSLC